EENNLFRKVKTKNKFLKKYKKHIKLIDENLKTD
ncbi:hypothetical protein UIS_01629, partial [Enterococcus faecium EnGen0313]